MKKKTYWGLITAAVVLIVFAIGISLSSSKLFRRQSSSPTSTTERQTISESASLEVHFFDVGEGDSALVECEGHYLLIDGGNPGNSSFLYSYLKQNKIEYLDYIVCSHAHADHVGGLAGALNYANVGVAYSPVLEYDSRAFNSFLKYLNEQNKTIRIPTPGESFSLGAAVVSFLGPLDMGLAETNENNSSIILRIQFGDTSFLFTGDAEKEEEISLVESGHNLQSTVLKVGHHGSNTSSSEQFLAAVFPNIAIISVGADNDYGHPHEEAMTNLSRYCDQIYRTDLQGEIVCISNGISVTVNTER